MLADNKSVAFQEDAKTTPLKKKLCFVIGPIGENRSPERKHADFLLNGIIKNVLENNEFDYEVRRADEDADPGMIGDRMIIDIINADLVLADLTDLNPNAFYELGIRHATQKPIIHLAKAGTKLPFDNAAQRTIFIDITDWNDIESARQRLAKSIRTVQSIGYQVSNPITQARAGFVMSESADPRDKFIAEIRERLTQSSVVENKPTKSDPTTYRSFINALVADDPDSAIEIYASVMNLDKESARHFVMSIRTLDQGELSLLYETQAQTSEQKANRVAKQVRSALLEGKNLKQQAAEDVNKSA